MCGSGQGVLSRPHPTPHTNREDDPRCIEAGGTGGVDLGHGDALGMEAGCLRGPQHRGMRLGLDRQAQLRLQQQWSRSDTVTTILACWEHRCSCRRCGERPTNAAHTYTSGSMRDHLMVPLQCLAHLECGGVWGMQGV